MLRKSIYTAHFITFLLLTTTLLSGNEDEAEIEPILRGAEEIVYPPALLIPEELPSYPWEIKGAPHLRPLTIDNFRCQGRKERPPKLKGDGEFQNDCDGSADHGLPVRNGKEGIQPILITLLNFLQEKTQSEVVVTSGHRCPRHQTYLNSSPKALSSKHQIGAEAAFYVLGWEYQAEKLIEVMESFYSEPFKRWDRETDVRTLPWYNDEVFIKLYLADEGRDEDNRHPHPFLNIQVRFDKEKGEKVQYTWKASQEYFR